MKPSSEQSPPVQSTAPNKAYPWLLGISTCLSAVLCWMYVTKPVMAAQQVVTGTAQGEPTTKVAAAKPSSKVLDITAHPVSSKQHETQLIPSENTLPGMTSDTPSGAMPAVGPPSSQVTGPESSNRIEPSQLLPSGDRPGWETTNSRVQHILSADTGNGDLSKIVLNVPVLYETRTMRWTPPDIQNARNILTRLMGYEGNPAKLKHEGKALLIDWNRLLEKTVPSSALRADSPSLPYNHTQGPRASSLSDSGNSIKIEQ